MAIQGLIGFIVVPGVNGEVQFPALRSTKGAIEEIIAGELVGKGVERTGADVPLQIPHRVEGGLADGGVIVVGSLAIFHAGEHVAVPVQHGAHRQLSAGIIEMAVKG